MEMSNALYCASFREDGTYNVRDLGGDVLHALTEREAWDALVDSGAHPNEASDILAEAQRLAAVPTDTTWEYIPGRHRRRWQVSGFGPDSAEFQTSKIMNWLLRSRLGFTRAEARVQMRIKRRLAG
jgi:hypothetical protein